MPFDTALSGIRAASSDLEVTGNNIANASTTGFKASRAEFSDVYATSVLGSGSNQPGAGVQVQDISQSFTQGNVTFTENQLDLAINGGGFFILSDGGDQMYSRAGVFGLDSTGYIVTDSGSRLQGYGADEAGVLGNIAGDLQVNTSIIDPRSTTSVSESVNLDATDSVLQSIGRQFVSQGNAIAETQGGLIDATTSVLEGATFTLPLANNFNTDAGGTAMTFDVSMVVLD